MVITKKYGAISVIDTTCRYGGCCKWGGGGGGCQKDGDCNGSLSNPKISSLYTSKCAQKKVCYYFRTHKHLIQQEG